MGKANFYLGNKNNKYFIDNYDVAFCTIFPETVKGIIIDDENDTCRFCGKTKGEVSFSDKCHAIPEFFGNKKVITKNECNNCNHKYADLIEDDLSKLTLPSRNITGVYGKKGVPKYKDIKTNNNCEYRDGIYKVNNYSDFFEFDEENKQFILKYETQKFNPLKAYKALVRIALNCMPKEYFDKFKMINWLENDDDLGGATNFYTKIIIKFVPKIPPMSNMCLFIRKENIKDVPYCQMVLQSNNIFYQVIIPFIEEDKHLGECKNVIINPFSFGATEDFDSTISVIDLSSKEKKSISNTFVLNYAKKELLDSK